MERDEKSPLFTEAELDALKEAMNISFGSASADLSELMDIFIQLNIPEVDVIAGRDLITYLSRNSLDFDTCSMVLQDYTGDFEGRIILLFPYGVEKELISYFQHPDNLTFQSDELVELEKEVLLEIGNLLIGACVGKFYDFLKSRISYRPPQCLLGRSYRRLLDTPRGMGSNERFISIKTYFSFEDRRVAGHLYLIHGEEAAAHLKKALTRFEELSS